jgi:hypothetical protein
MRFVFWMLMLVLWAVYHFYSPTFLWCTVFWSYMFVGVLLRGQLLFVPGIASNALATLFNDGKMPVFGVTEVTPGGVHVLGTPASALPFLCDRFAGASIGDFMLLAAILLEFVVRFGQHKKAPSTKVCVKRQMIEVPVFCKLQSRTVLL